MQRVHALSAVCGNKGKYFKGKVSSVYYSNGCTCVRVCVFVFFVIKITRREKKKRGKLGNVGTSRKRGRRRESPSSEGVGCVKV